MNTFNLHGLFSIQETNCVDIIPLPLSFWEKNVIHILNFHALSFE